MSPMRKMKTLSAMVALLISATVSAYADDATTIQKKLESQFAITQPTADKTDIVTPGTVLVLQKDKLTTVVVSGQMIYAMSTYKDGKINLNAAAKTSKAGELLKKCPVFMHCPQVPQTPDAPATRVFVKNEKMWVTKINVNPDKVVFELFTDAYNDNRFKASLNFPIANGASADDVAKLVGEVFTVDPGDDKSSKDQDAKSAKPGPAAQGESAMNGSNSGDDQKAVIPPAPPPPPDAPVVPPKTTTLGQTPDQVTANLGQPDNIINKGKIQIYFYKSLGLKVTFTGGKVTDIQ
jgi:hypothetical protein